MATRTADFNPPAASPTAAAAAEPAVPPAIRSMRLGELRDLVNLTQAQLAGRLNVVQSAVAKYESAGNPKVGTLRSVVEGLGGELSIVVRLPGEDPIRLELRADDGDALPRRRRATAG